MLLSLLIASTALSPPLVVEGENVRLLAYRTKRGVWAEQLSAKDKKGKMRMILMSPGVISSGKGWQSGAVQGASKGLYSAVPDFGFTDVKVVGKSVTFSVKSSAGTFAKTVTIPAKGNQIKLELNADFGVRRTQLHALLMSYAFTPDTRPDKPDSTFLPGLRPNDDNVVGDHFFRAPAAAAQKGTLAAILMPDLDVLADNRPMETVLDLDAKSGVSPATLLTYGFAAHRLTGHVAFSTDSSMIRNVPGKLRLAADLLLDANAEPFGAYGEAVSFQWKKYGHRYFDKIKPQMMPFAEYAKVCYPAAFKEQYGANKLGWFETTIDGQVCGGIPSGWGFTNGWVSWQCWFNQLRSAWGLRWWGRKLGNQDWVDKADKMLNLALAAPMDGGAVPTTYLSRTGEWKGSLIAPDPRCYYDLTNIAWKGIWLLRWLEFKDCPRQEEIIRQTSHMAVLMARSQNKDGSFPTWLDKDLKPVPILDHSAQSALPAWFLAEILKFNAKEVAETKFYTKEKRGEYEPGSAVRIELGPAVLSAANFLVKNVVDQQRYYDFETFFSCSPKQCLQVKEALDDPRMHDSHSLSPPQNTLCMQWTAEALFAVDGLAGSAAKSDDRSLHSKYASAAKKALDIMALYQNVWPISYRKAAYTYGGFGVQNSDGEYNDARQAQFGCTMADYGAATGKQDWFERGVAATRATLTLINHPLHAENGIYPNPNYPLGLEPENSGHGGTDEQDGRTGFDWGEGSGLASMAWLLEKYGPTYRNSKWTVIVDGENRGAEIARAGMPKPTVDPSWIFSENDLPGWTITGNFAETPTWSTRFDFGIGRDEAFIGTAEDGRGGYDDSFQGEILSPVFTVTKPKLTLMVGGGSGKGVYVELVDALSKVQLSVSRGSDQERMHAVDWDVSRWRGRKLQVRIVDKETGGWGHINVGRIQASN